MLKYISTCTRNLRLGDMFSVRIHNMVHNTLLMNQHNVLCNYIMHFSRYICHVNSFNRNDKRYAFHMSWEEETIQYNNYFGYKLWTMKSLHGSASTGTINHLFFKWHRKRKQSCSYLEYKLWAMKSLQGSRISSMIIWELKHSYILEN